MLFCRHFALWGGLVIKRDLRCKLLMSLFPLDISKYYPPDLWFGIDFNTYVFKLKVNFRTNVALVQRRSEEEISHRTGRFTLMKNARRRRPSSANDQLLSRSDGRVHSRRLLVSLFALIRRWNIQRVKILCVHLFKCLQLSNWKKRLLLKNLFGPIMYLSTYPTIIIKRLMHRLHSDSIATDCRFVSTASLNHTFFCLIFVSLHSE